MQFTSAAVQAAGQAGAPTCDQDVGLCLSAGAQELHGIRVVNLAQHLQL